MVSHCHAPYHKHEAGFSDKAVSRLALQEEVNDASNEEGQTALHAAAESGNEEVRHALRIPPSPLARLSLSQTPTFASNPDLGAKAHKLTPYCTVGLQIIEAALFFGANPCLLDERGRVPYFLCQTKGARDAFRRQRGKEPERWGSWVGVLSAMAINPLGRVGWRAASLEAEA